MSPKQRKLKGFSKCVMVVMGGGWWWVMVVIGLQGSVVARVVRSTHFVVCGKWLWVVVGGGG